MNEEIKDAAITLLQTLINATGAEPEDERLAIQIIAKTMQEVVNENNLLQRVSQRSELLAFAKEMQNIGFNEMDDAEKVVDIYIKANCG